MVSNEYTEGYEAFWNDKEMSDCPYSEDDEAKYMDWRSGWFWAYAETK